MQDAEASGDVTLTIAAWIPVATFTLALLGLVFAIIRWCMAEAEKRRLAGVICASHLEAIARQCVDLSRDAGTHDAPEYHGIDIYKDVNTATVQPPDIPDFHEIEGVASLSSNILNCLMVLDRANESIRSHVGHLCEHDLPDYGEGFEARRLYYASFGEFCARLAKDVRARARASAIDNAPDALVEELRDRMDNLVADFEANPKRLYQASQVEDPRFVLNEVEGFQNTLGLVFLKPPLSYWPERKTLDRIEQERRDAKRRRNARLAEIRENSPLPLDVGTASGATANRSPDPVSKPG